MDVLHDKGRVMVICDGMGGAKAEMSQAKWHGVFVAEVKSVYASMTAPYMRAVMTDAVNAANAAVFERSQEDSAFYGMGRLLSGFDGCGDCAVMNVGDSAIALGRRDKAVSNDHSLAEELLRQGDLRQSRQKISARKHDYRGWNRRGS